MQLIQKELFLNTVKYTLISLAVLLTILALGSCGKKKIGSDPQLDYMSFTLTNVGGAPVDTTTPLSRGSTYGLVITPGSGVVPATADYIITYTPTAAITGIATNINSVDFRVNNTADTSITITVTHRTASAVSETLTLNLVPQSPNMLLALTNSGGATVGLTAELSRSSTYGLVITPGSGVVPSAADYIITYTPDTAITGIATNTNSVDFRVNSVGDVTVSFTVTHRTASAISETLTLSLAAPVVTAFGQEIETTTTVPNLATADQLIRDALTPLAVTTGVTLVKRYATETGAGNRDGSSWTNAWSGTSLRNNINAISDATATRVYLIMIAGGTYKPGINRGDSFSMKNYVTIMGGFEEGGGWGRTGTTIFSGDIGTVGTTTDNSYQVFNHNRITLGNSHLYGVTITNGNANGGGIANDGGGMYNLNLSSSPVLTRVVFSGNTADRGGGMYNANSSPVLTKVIFSGNTADRGGGMYNQGSSPVLTEVVLSGNTATSTTAGGGGMLNDGSSPVLTEVVFSGNTATTGGGMYSWNISFPVLSRVVFSGNTATTGGGGGMYNERSSPLLTSVVFSGNITTSDGGGMYNSVSIPIIIGAVFSRNHAANGGGMLNDNNGEAGGPFIVNSIFSGNTLSGTGSGTNIAMNLGGTGAENIRIAGSVLGIGLAQPTNDIVGYNGSAALNIEYHSLTNGPVRFGADATLTINGMNFTYPTIVAGSSAINLGLYARRRIGGNYYFSETEATTSWHTGFTSTGGFAGTAAILPTTGTIEDLAATDITGNARSGRPDAGVYELP